MSNLLLSNKQMYEACRNATLSAYEGKVDQKSLTQLLDNMEMLAENPGRGVEASANIVSAVIWAKIICEPKNLPWIIEEQAWAMFFSLHGLETVVYLNSIFEINFIPAT